VQLTAGHFLARGRPHPEPHRTFAAGLCSCIPSALLVPAALPAACFPPAAPSEKAPSCHSATPRAARSESRLPRSR
jgi:hypothetical protein